MEPTENISNEEKAELTSCHNICSPISTLNELWTYTDNPPKWIDKVIELKTRSNFVIKNTSLRCHTESNNFTQSLRLDRQTTPRTLVCHDMKGGYIEDKYVEPVNIGNGYTFYRWSQIDIFVYFSHHLITIPPLSWINAAHNNGVKILGTFITEWNPGKEICEQIFANSNTLTRFADILIDICILFKLDGWLLNIENELGDTNNLKKFIKYLTERVHIKRPSSMIIWYDSIREDGKLDWQNELNIHNRCYFDACDGIFLNYSWNEDNLKNSMKAAEHRCLDVFVGVDVFGRNFFGGGNFNTHLALEKIREYNLSAAIFAQGWTHETLNPEPANTLLERFLIRDNTFWKSLWPYLYTHPINTTFDTFFHVGVDSKWYKLHSQQVQLTQFLNSHEKLDEAVDISTLAETCTCLQMHFYEPYTLCSITNKNFEMEKSHVHHLFSCELKIFSNVVLYFYIKKLDAVMGEHEGDGLNLVLLVRNSNGSVKKIICCFKNSQTLINNLSMLEVNYCQDAEVIEMLTAQHTVPTDWIFRCYILNLTDCSITDIGAEISSGSCVCLCGIGIQELGDIKI